MTTYTLVLALKRAVQIIIYSHTQMFKHSNFYITFALFLFSCRFVYVYGLGYLLKKGAIGLVIRRLYQRRQQHSSNQDAMQHACSLLQSLYLQCAFSRSIYSIYSSKKNIHIYYFFFCMCNNFHINSDIIILNSTASLSKDAVGICILDFMQTIFFYLERFLKKLSRRSMFFHNQRQYLPY